MLAAILALSAAAQACQRVTRGRECLSAAYQSGHCENPEAAWSFDVQKRECKQFQYTGCSPSDNVFPSEEECEQKCGRFGKVKSCKVPFDYCPKRCPSPS